MFEIFFDLVFVFALTRVITFMAGSPSALTLAQGLLLLLLLLYSWGAVHLGGKPGPRRTSAWSARPPWSRWRRSSWPRWCCRTRGNRARGCSTRRSTLALAYVVGRAVQLVILFWVSATNPPLRSTLRFFTVPVVLAWLPLIVGALLGGAAQTALWTVALLVDIGGARIASTFRPWQLRSVDHFTERFGLVLIIALGESLISAGAGPRTMAPVGAAVLAALLGLTSTVCLWWLYFDRLAPAAREAVSNVPGERRAGVAGDAYGLGHSPLIIGAIYVALGIEEVISPAHRGVGAFRPAGLGGRHRALRRRRPLPAQQVGLPPADRWRGRTRRRSSPRCCRWPCCRSADPCRRWRRSPC